LTDKHPPHPPATAKDLRSFGFTFGVVALAFGAFLAWRGRPIAPWFVAASALFFLVGGLIPGLLRPAFGPWMKFAEILGYINTRILLGLFYYVGVTPTGLLMRISGKDPLTRTFKEKDTPSYWTKPTPHGDGDRHFNRQF
jgi:Saxitoxin biosynthesis operon protein SxtJ